MERKVKKGNAHTRERPHTTPYDPVRITYRLLAESSGCRFGYTYDGRSGGSLTPRPLAEAENNQHTREVRAMYWKNKKKT